MTVPSQVTRHRVDAAVAELWRVPWRRAGGHGGRDALPPALRRRVTYLRQRLAVRTALSAPTCRHLAHRR